MTDQLKIALLLIGVFLFLTFSISLKNGVRIEKLQDRQDSLKVVVDSMKIHLECDNVAVYLSTAKYK